jgi:hypothetical protein
LIAAIKSEKVVKQKALLREGFLLFGRFASWCGQLLVESPAK